MTSSVSSEYPLTCCCGSSSSDSGGNAESVMPTNSGICCSRSARSLFSIALIVGSILIGSRLDCLTVSTLRTTWRSLRAARAARRSPALRTPLPSRPKPLQRVADQVHDAQPRDAGGKGQRDQEQREQEQGRAKKAESVHQQVADDVADD